MTNVVLVRHEGDFSCSGYLFETPVDLKKGQRVRVKTRRGEVDAIVIHDSAEVDDILRPVRGWQQAWLADSM